MKDEHPVQWLIDSLKPEIYSPMNDWFQEVLSERPFQPADVLMPDPNPERLCSKF